MGDINVRIGQQQQNIEEVYKVALRAEKEARNSQDTTLNKKGREFLEFCEDFGLVVLNGRTEGDVNGSFTYVSTRGSSVNDICAATQEILGIVKTFSVEETIWSDHLPIRLNLNLNGNLNNKKEMNLLPKLKWKDV